MPQGKNKGKKKKKRCFGDVLSPRDSDTTFYKLKVTEKPTLGKWMK